MKDLKMFLFWLWGAALSASWFVPFIVPRFDYWSWLLVIPGIATFLSLMLGVGYLCEKWDNE